MIQIKNLGKYYGEHKVLHDISLSVEQGDVFGIVGHSGAGKSTLLR
ncbi:MAG: ATP-binding cassette domain-containing protein, partial [Synergistaceae bacterium]